MNDELDSELMNKVMRSVRLEARESMSIRIARRMNGTETDSHTLEYVAGADLQELQREVTRVARRWGHFAVGVSYVVERTR